MSEITYRLLDQVADLQQVVALQKLIWGEDPNNNIPLHMLHSLSMAGCPLIGAFHEDHLVGFSAALFGLESRHSERPAIVNLKLASKRLAVHPDYRSSGIARQMKIEQYHFAKKQGIQHISWTFDPLLSRNAHLYIRRLGGMVRQFYVDYYQGYLGQLDTIGGTDRMICDWWINTKRVEERLFGHRKALGIKQYLEANAPIVNPVIFDPNLHPLPPEGSIDLGEHSLLLVEIPSDLGPLRQNEALAHSWREHSRAIFDALFGYGYIVTDFLHEDHEGHRRSFYVFGLDKGN